tara:strand:- start:339 stop:545 length:207 start_codon:yes stop_codon:yes gene_type:complete
MWISRRHSMTLDSIAFAFVSIAGLKLDCAKAVPDIRIGASNMASDNLFIVDGLVYVYPKIEIYIKAQA